MPNYRIQNKTNVHMNGKRTQFDIYELQGDAYRFIGKGTASGWDAPDERCISAFLSD